MGGMGGAGPDVIDHLRAVTSRATAIAATAEAGRGGADGHGTAEGRGAGKLAGHDRNGSAGQPGFQGRPGSADEAGPARGPGSRDRQVMVFEPASGGLLTLLAHSAVSDLAQLDATVRVSTATSPGQGAAMLAAEPFWCVVVDLGMPAALEFLDQVREKPELREIPVLAHAAGQQDDGVRSLVATLRAGYPSLELLPSLDDLRERITLHLSVPKPGQVPPFVAEAPGLASRQATAASQLTALPDHPALRGKHVLVIDDDARNVFAITSTLELHGLLVYAGERRPPRHRGAARRTGDRPHPDGRHDAGHGRLRDDGRHQADAPVRAAAHHRRHRARHARRPREEPGRGRQRLRDQAGGHRRAAELHGALAVQGLMSG